MLTVEEIKARYQGLVAPGNDIEFYRLLTEAEERLMVAGCWHWTRIPLTISVNVDSQIVLPAAYESVVGARISGAGVGVKWQEAEYLQGGPGLIPVDGCRAELVDQGVLDIEDTMSRVYKVVGFEIEEVDVLAKLETVTYSEESENILCPLAAPIKQMMYSIIYEENNDTTKSMEYSSMAINQIMAEDKSYRGLATEIVTPSMFQPIPYRSRHNFA